ncbi:MAG: triose-phosphate isomerase [Planctomycetes bacterium]|nr:triose-phosphate isomerase [Planctomycetota bacterium]
MRRKFIAGNWKMFTNAAGAEQLAAAIVKGLGQEMGVDVALCPPFPYLSRVAITLKGSVIALGAQNFYPEKEGAFTGEVSPAMLVDVGCRYAIVGHSERRHKLGETDAFINKKIHSGLAAGLRIILCIGETLQEREANATEKVLDTHVTAGIAGVKASDLQKITLAYEPVWAIGTGRNATPDQAQESHAFVRRRVAQLYGKEAAENLVIQYGGSVRPDNAAILMAEPDVDGALVGGASLQAEQFFAIVRGAMSVK